MKHENLGQIVQNWQGYWAFYPKDNQDIYGRPVYISWDKQTLIDWVNHNYKGWPEKIYERKSAKL